MKTILLFVCSLLIALLSNAQNASQWRGVNRDGVYQESGLLTKWPDKGPELLWSHNELGDGHSSATVYKNKVYTGGTNGQNGFVVAFNMNGKIEWLNSYGKEWMDSYDGIRSTPMIYQDKLYIMSGYGVIYCINANDGKLVWTVDAMTKYSGENIKWGVTENLLAYDNKLICTAGGKENNVIALDVNTGELIWKCPGKGEKSAYCSPKLVVYNGRKIVVTQTESSILGIDGENGKLLWSHSFPNRYSVHANTPLYQNGQIFCSSGYGKGSVMLQLSGNGESISVKWEDTQLDNRFGGNVLLNGKIYGAGDASKKWVCLDWETGKELYSNSEIKKGNLIAADGMLYWYSEDGKVYLVKPGEKSFEIISSFDVPYGEKQHWAHIVIDSKRLYVRHGSSLMVYNLAK